MSLDDQMKMSLEEIMNTQKKQRTQNKGQNKGRQNVNRRERVQQNTAQRRGGNNQRQQRQGNNKKYVAPVVAQRQKRINNQGNNQRMVFRKSAYAQQRDQKRQGIASKNFGQQDRVLRKKLSQTKLRVSGLQFNIVNKELYDLFSQFGPLTKCKIDFDDLGRSQGKAIVQYENQSDARKAIQEYNGAILDGQTLRIEFVNQRVFRSNEVQRVVPLRKKTQFKKNNQQTGTSKPVQGVNSNRGGGRFIRRGGRN